MPVKRIKGSRVDALADVTCPCDDEEALKPIFTLTRGLRLSLQPGYQTRGLSADLRRHVGLETELSLASPPFFQPLISSPPDCRLKRGRTVALSADVGGGGGGGGGGRRRYRERGEKMDTLVTVPSART